VTIYELREENSNPKLNMLHIECKIITVEIFGLDSAPKHRGLNRDAEGMPSDGDADCCDKWGGLKQRTVEDMRRDHSND